jgi:hypothetical protein
MAEAVIAVGTAVLVFVAFGQLVTFYWQLPQNVVAGARFGTYFRPQIVRIRLA